MRCGMTHLFCYITKVFKKSQIFIDNFVSIRMSINIFSTVPMDIAKLGTKFPHFQQKSSHSGAVLDQHLDVTKVTVNPHS